MNSRRRTLCRRLASASWLTLLLAGFVLAQPASPMRSITYRLSMPRPASHLFEVTIEVEFPYGAKPASLDFQMARWSPGRYAVFDFAKNVQEVRAASGTCPPPGRCDLAMRPVTRVDDQTWRVALSGDQSVTLFYKVFADDLSGTFSQLNTRHANFNGGNIFMYVVNHKPDPVTLAIDPPRDWRISNGRIDHTDQQEWKFPNWDIMIDTPTELGSDWTEDNFQVGSRHYHVVVHSLGSEGGKRAALVRDIEKIVRAETAMWGAPEFDSYTFLIHFANDGTSGDGMEHLTSTQIIQPGALGDAGTLEDTLGTVAHEFFHVWNVKRLRPVGLGPWDFTRPANTRGLWVAEGFTNYYGHLMLRRASVWNEARFLARESETITQIENAPGSHLMSAEEASLTAPFLDRASHAQHTNLDNTSISYYPKGELIGMVLDLLIRGKTKGRVSLDEVMRRMYEEYYLKAAKDSYYLRGRGYTPEDLERVASAVAGFDLHDFFKRYALGTEGLPYDEAFGYVGLRIVTGKGSAPFDAGLVLDRKSPLARVQAVRLNSFADTAGLQADDVVLSIDGKNVDHDSLFISLNHFKEGDRVPLVVKRNKQTIRTSLILGKPDHIEYRIEGKQDATKEEKQLRAAWLS